MTKTRNFKVSHLKGAAFERRGLRNYFEYRDLGIERATRGKVVAHVIRARPGTAPHGEWHSHDVDVQFVYVLKGWVLFEYEGVGRVMMKAGSCFYQPPRIRHRELKHSADVEMLEIVSPAKFETFEAKPQVRGRSPNSARAASPNSGRGARTSPVRRSRG